MQPTKTERTTRSAPAEQSRAPVVARFTNMGSARLSIRELAREGVEVIGKPVVSTPKRHRRFQLERGRCASMGALLGAATGALAAAVFVGLGGGALAAGSVPPMAQAVLGGALLIGTLGLIGGFAVGEPRATRATTDALREGEAEGEVAVRFAVPVAKWPAIVRRLRRLGALDVSIASHGAPQV